MQPIARSKFDSSEAISKLEQIRNSLKEKASGLSAKSITTDSINSVAQKNAYRSTKGVWYDGRNVNNIPLAMYWKVNFSDLLPKSFFSALYHGMIHIPAKIYLYLAGEPGNFQFQDQLSIPARWFIPVFILKLFNKFNITNSLAKFFIGFIPVVIFSPIKFAFCLLSYFFAAIGNNIYYATEYSATVNREKDRLSREVQKESEELNSITTLITTLNQKIKAIKDDSSKAQDRVNDLLDDAKTCDAIKKHGNSFDLSFLEDLAGKTAATEIQADIKRETSPEPSIVSSSITQSELERQPLLSHEETTEKPPVTSVDSSTIQMFGALGDVAKTTDERALGTLLIKIRNDIYYSEALIADNEELGAALPKLQQNLTQLTNIVNNFSGTPLGAEIARVIQDLQQTIASVRIYENIKIAVRDNGVMESLLSGKQNIGPAGILKLRANLTNMNNLLTANQSNPLVQNLRDAITNTSNILDAIITQYGDTQIANTTIAPSPESQQKTHTSATIK